MNKNIYSLVLSDDVIEKVDALSYQLHTSRSNVVNQILAEHFAYVTPEMRMKSIFSSMDSLLNQFRILEQTSAHMYALQSQLNYKYKPTVQYSVELFKTPADGRAGKLRISLRTQNQALLISLNQFFKLWILLEQKYLPVKAEYQISAGRLERSILAPDTEETEFGKLLSGYIRHFDSYLKRWFSGESAQELENSFRQEAQLMEKLI